MVPESVPDCCKIAESEEESLISSRVAIFLVGVVFGEGLLVSWLTSS
jgi:hypothetical protein